MTPELLKQYLEVILGPAAGVAVFILFVIRAWKGRD